MQFHGREVDVIQLWSAWAAGFLDGEGCFSIAREKRGTGNIFRPLVTAAQKDQAPLKKLQELYGGSIRFDSRGDIWVWSVSGAKTLMEILPMWIPWLTVKKKQAQAMVEFCVGVEYTNSKPLTKQEIKRRERLFERVRELKAA